MKKRIGSMILTLAMVLTLFPCAAIPARAAEGEHSHDGWMALTQADFTNAGTDASMVKVELYASTANVYVIDGGNYYLNENINIQHTLVLRGTVNLCLNGHVLKYAGNDNINDYFSGSVIYLDSATLNLYDEGTGSNTITDPTSNATITVAGGAISGGDTYEGGGIWASKSIVHMYGGNIAGNKAVAHGGGVDVVWSNSEFYLHGGNICYNSVTGNAGWGGGVRVDLGGEFIMDGGKINDNSSGLHGGGVYVSDGSFTMTGGEISSNTASDMGGGVSLTGSSGTINLGGAAKIISNTSSYYGENNLDLEEWKTNIISTLTKGASIGITLYPYGSFTNGFNSYNRGDDPAKYFSADNTLYMPYLDRSGEVTLIGAGTVIFDPNGGTGTSVTEKMPTTATPLKANTFTRAGYTFNGWNTKADGTGDGYADGANFAAFMWVPVTLYAQWMPEPATTPTISGVTGASLTYGYAANSGSISVTASAADGHTLSYQWYYNTANSSEGGTAISGATDANYTIPAGSNVGTYYYYCVVTATRTDNNQTANATSGVAAVTVGRAELSGIAVTMANYTYGSTPSTPSVSGNPESTTVTYYYSTVSFLRSDEGKEKTTEGTPWSGITGTTLKADTTYFLRAVLAESDNYTQYVTDQITFTVTKATPAAPIVSGYTVTIDEADRAKRLEYAVVTNGSAAPTTYKPVPTLSDGAFMLSGLAKETSYTIYLRERASADGNYTASAATSTNWTTPTEWTVVYNANRGTGTVPATQNGTGTTAVTISSDSGLSRAGYTFSNWNTKADGTGTAYSVGASINTGATLYAQWTPNTYTVKFNANGGTGTIEDESFTYDKAQALTTNTFTRDGYTFAGWSTSTRGPVLYGDGQSVKNLAVSGNMTLYAVWTQNTYAVTGSITSETNGTVTLKLMQGNAQFATVDVTISDGSGTYQFNGVPAGTYNLVAIQGDQTVTALIVITNAGVTQNITMPSHKVNSVLKVEGEDTPPVVVGGLDAEAESKAEDSKTITITMTIEKQEEQQLPETATEEEQETQEAIEAIESAASGSDGLEYMNITVQKEVKNGSTTESTETLTTTSTVMEIVIPYDMNGKTNIKVYRHHDGAAAALTQADTKADGTYQIDTANGLIYVYANQFSTYAIAYEQARSNPVTPPSPSDETTDPAPKSCPQDETCPISAFTDADPKAWYHDGVHYVLENGIMGGYGNGLFGPSDNTSRAMMAQILWNMEGKPIVDYTLSYTDVRADKWYIEAIRWATAEDIMEGYGGGLFGPDDAMTREQLAAIVHRYAIYKGVDMSATSDLLGYTDADKVSGWAMVSMKWAVGSGAVLGRTATTLNPKDTATRAEIAQIVKNYDTKVK